MSTNHYFNNIRANNEQNLVEDLVIETIKIHGVDVLYLPRTIVNKDVLFGEDPLSRFSSVKPIEMYMENVQSFSGQQDILGKFGLEVQDAASFVVSKKRFQKETGMVRPLEGDIIYFPLTKGFFEIKYVEHESPFYNLGKNYVFKLSTELFQFSEERFNTGEEEVDAIPNNIQFKVFATFGTTGSVSTAFAINDYVYQYTNGATAGGYGTADAIGVVDDISDNVVTIKNIKGKWEASSSSVSRYIISNSGNVYRVVTGITDSINTDDYDDNKDIEDLNDGELDTRIRNPFGTP